MNYLEVDEFVSNFVMPIIEEHISEFLETDRPAEWFDDEDELEEFANSEIPYSLKHDIVSAVKKNIKSCDCDFSQVTSKTIDEDLLDDMIGNMWEPMKTDHVTDVQIWLEEHQCGEELDEDESYD